MKMIFPETVEVTRECTHCGRETVHEKEGTNHVFHFLITFCSFFLWSPFWIAMAILQSTRPFECRDCRVATPVNVEPLTDPA